MQETISLQSVGWGTAWPRLLIGVTLGVITLLHYLTGAHLLPYHSIYRSLYYLPIAVAAVLWGLRGGLFVASTISALYLPHVLMLGREVHGGLLDNLLEIVAFNSIAALAGWLADVQRRQRHEIATLQGYLDAILVSLPIGIATMNPGGEIVARNPAARPLIHDLGEDVTLPPESRYIEIVQDGRTLGIRRSPLQDANGASKGDVLVIEDLSEQRRLQERVRQAERLAALGQLAGGLAHEVRNPLAILRATTQLLGAKLAYAADLRRYTRVLTDEADRIDRLVNALLSYASPQVPVFAAVDARSLLVELTTACESYAAEQAVMIETDLPEERLAVVGDREQLRQALLNLMLNAIQASPAGARVAISARQMDTRICFVVRDHGVGIPNHIRSRVFDPFFTTRDDGTGMGLAVVARIVADHGGTIELEEAPGGGTLAQLCLPIPSGEQHPGIAQSRTTGGRRNG